MAHEHLAFYANPVEQEITELSTTLAAHHMTRPSNPLVHPGEILREEFLVPLGMSRGYGDILLNPLTVHPFGADGRESVTVIPGAVRLRILDADGSVVHERSTAARPRDADASRYFAKPTIARPCNRLPVSREGWKCSNGSDVAGRLQGSRQLTLPHLYANKAATKPIGGRSKSRATWSWRTCGPIRVVPPIIGNK